MPGGGGMDSAQRGTLAPASTQHSRTPSNACYNGDGDEPDDYVVPKPELQAHKTPPGHEVTKVSRTSSGKGQLFETKYRQRNLCPNMMAQMRERERAAKARASAVSEATFF